MRSVKEIECGWVECDVLPSSVVGCAVQACPAALPMR